MQVELKRVGHEAAGLAVDDAVLRHDVGQHHLASRLKGLTLVHSSAQPELCRSHHRNYMKPPVVSAHVKPPRDVKECTPLPATSSSPSVVLSILILARPSGRARPGRRMRRVCVGTLDHWYSETLNPKPCQSEQCGNQPVAVCANIAGKGGQAPLLRHLSSAGRSMARSCAAVCVLLAGG